MVGPRTAPLKAVVVSNRWAQGGLSCWTTQFQFISIVACSFRQKLTHVCTFVFVLKPRVRRTCWLLYIATESAFHTFAPSKIHAHEYFLFASKPRERRTCWLRYNVATAAFHTLAPSKKHARLQFWARLEAQSEAHMLVQLLGSAICLLCVLSIKTNTHA